MNGDAVEMDKRSRGRPKNDENNSPAAKALRQMAKDKAFFDRKSHTPLWVQFKNALADKIHCQVLLPDMRLPSEQTICEIFGVSRSVVRMALGSLATEGLLYKVARTGVFVAQPRMETDFLTSNMSVHADLEARGYTVTSKTFEFSRVKADDAEIRVFNLSKDGTVVRIGRIYYSDGAPITHTIISLPGYKVPDFEHLDIEDKSMFQLLKDRYGLVAKRAERWFTAAMPSVEVCERLALSSDQPVIAIESIAYDTNDMPLEFYRAYYNSAVARIHVATSNGDSGSN
ncbi:GntR family transcriptional regulator [Marinomonas sp. CT5]|uniref:GntR family transcriptional regulator n=1 Tax=Marinomonas sp. CT5 TaxID=2066133 RepID=UPI001BAF94F3|nr:GntR family transcriptional regulator [Marinomonas sp. CT5]QUX97667.1 GntR family transcriptional regulator [Marinomonas sp. CT5]